MGNSESQYSLQGSRSCSFTLPNRQKPYSVKLRSSKEDVLSPRGWWRTGPRVSGFKSKTASRGCLQHKSNQSSVSRHHDYISNGSEAKRRISVQRNGSPRAHAMPPSENGRLDVNGRDCNGQAANGYKTPERKLKQEEVEDHSSPRVVIKSDGSVRVEFNQISKNSTLPDENGGPVQLLKFSPTSRAAPAPDREPASAPSSPIAKRSSLSSEGSWYDSPWGPGAELNDPEGNLCAAPDRVSETLPSVRIEYFDEQLPPRYLYHNPVMAATFPTAKDLTLANEMPLKHRASFVCVTQEPVLDESSGARQYSSFTLPCPKPKPVTENAGKKETIRNRMRRIGDWTGSLTRRKRKSKEPRYKEPLDCFDSGIDGLTADTSSPSQVSSLLGYPRVQSRGRSQSQVLPSCGGSAGALHPGTDSLRQNIYDNFMRELETSQTAAGSREERGENSAEETESSSQETVGSLEQLDLLCEKEQGVVRRAGWLTFKPLITLHKDRKLELVARRKWRQYWVMLKGCSLLFYETYGKGSPEQETSPSYALLAEDGIVQAVPEHPKKENVFCLSNAYGDVYLFQATSQTDLENWVTAIHSASASLFAKRHGKEDTPLLLRGQIRSLLQKIDMDGKMKKMAELQLSVVTDPKNRKAIENQIQQWDQNLERFNLDLFRLRCYLSSLQGGELPNPKSLLATASRPSKAALGRLGIFSVSSFHALICSRDEATLRKRSLSLSQRGHSRRGVFSSLKGLDSLTKRSRERRPCASQVFDSAAGEQFSFLPLYSRERLDAPADGYSLAPPDGGQWDRGVMEKPVWVYMPDCQVVSVALSGQHTLAEVLSTACGVQNLDPSAHCLRLRRCINDQVEVWTPAPHELLQDLLYDELEVSALSVYTLHMTKPTCTGDFGFAVTGHVDVLSHSRIFVTEVLSDGVAFSEGLRPGDEILVLNGCRVSSLDLALIQTLFAENTLHLTVRREPTAPTHTPLTHTPSTHTPLTLTPPAHTPLTHTPSTHTPLTHTPSTHTPLTLTPPAHTPLTLTPPAHSSQQAARDSLYRHHRAKSATDVSCVSEASGEADVETRRLHRQSLRDVTHSKSVETVCSLYHSFQDASGGLMEVQKETTGPDAALLRPCPRHMSVSERLRKVVQELVDTEKSYVKDLSCLFEIYLKPLQKETFLTPDEMESLFGSLPEMLDFQKVFLQTLEERIASTPDFSTLETPVQFKKLLFSLGGSFLYYADHFKLYSGFCANHIKVQKVLERAKTDRAFKEFLDARNPTKQHSSTLESYLIKPVQRVLKYPLLLRELVSLTDTDSEEHYHLTEALKAMEKVASHINEMQKIYEDYGAVFDQLVAEQSGLEKEVTEISMGEFLMHSSVMWLNPLPALGRMKKEPELTVFVFKKAVILVCRESNKLKKKMNVPRSAHSHADQDPFKFRWLVPRSALQVRLGNTAESNCVWELIHTKSELEGRPETVFQLCSSTPESKVNMVKVIRAVLRENVRKGMRGTEQPAERTCKEHLAPLKGSLPSSAKLGSSRASWLCQKPIGINSPPKSDTLKPTQLDSDSASESSGDPPPGQSSQAPPTNSTLRRGSVRESDILSDDDGFSERSARRDSTPGSIETRFHELRLSDEARAEPEGGEEAQPQLRRAHFSAVRRRSARSEPRRSQAALLSMKQHSRSLDCQSESAAVSVDLNTLLERDFSVHSLTSVINEDCFYENGAKSSAAATTS